MDIYCTAERSDQSAVSRLLLEIVKRWIHFQNIHNYVYEYIPLNSVVVLAAAMAL